MFPSGLLMVAVLALLAWWLLRPQYDFTFRTGPQPPVVEGRLSQAERQQIAEFLRGELRDAPPFRVRGRRTREGRLILEFRGDVPPGLRQQVRNFLTNCL